jgi:hypothetical protein
MWPTPLLIHLEEEGWKEEGDDDKDPNYHHPCVYFLKFESKVDPVHAMMMYGGVEVWLHSFLNSTIDSDE